MDIIFRCLLATFSFGSKNIYFHTVLNGPPRPPKALEFDGNHLQFLPTDEIQMGYLFQTLLYPQEIPAIAGITISDHTFYDIAMELAALGPIFILKEKSSSFWEQIDDLYAKKATLESISFILGDSIDLTQQEEDFLITSLGATPIDLGAQRYLASHCIVFVLMTLKESGLFKNTL